MSFKRIDKEYFDSKISDFHEYSSNPLTFEFMKEIKPSKDIAETEKYFSNLLSDPKKLIYCVEIMGKVVGTISMNCESKRRGIFSMGFAFSPLVWGQPSILNDIVSVIIKTFEVENARRIETITEIGNLRCQKLLDFMGFKKEGEKKGYYVPLDGSKPINAIIHAAFKDDIRKI